ncbi:serine hydrolase [Rhizobium leguminosarum]|uniref:serine hydrolase n=1 Tax=Rhizobium leguminosarum TaxID=384 RepID=UPI001C95CCDD|nr:serine hydrolase [Rhizobium leguminosarum]MBY5363649.1 serine hydrolase [Rhizobium leguminosarum]
MSEAVFPDGAWEHAVSAPRQSDLLSRAAEALGAFGSIGIVVIHKGRFVLDVGAIDEKVLIRSVRKSILSSLFGIEIERGSIRLDAAMEELRMDDIRCLTTAERQATVHHLLQARSGIYHPALAESKAMTEAKPPRGVWLQEAVGTTTTGISTLSARSMSRRPADPCTMASGLIPLPGSVCRTSSRQTAAIFEDRSPARGSKNVPVNGGTIPTAGNRARAGSSGQEPAGMRVDRIYGFVDVVCLTVLASDVISARIGFKGVYAGSSSPVDRDVGGNVFESNTALRSSFRLFHTITKNCVPNLQMFVFCNCSPRLFRRRPRTTARG